MKRNKKETQTKAVLCILVLLFTTTLTLLPRGESKHIDDLVVDFHFSAPQVEETLIDNIMYHTITMTDTQPSGSAGEPCLPTRGISLLLPQGRTVKDITITKSQKQHVGFGYLIQPVGEPVPLSDSTSARLPIPQKELYSSHSVFPSAIFETVGIHSYRGYQILLLNIHPVQYIPASGEVSYFTDLTIVVHLQPSDAADILYRGRENDKKDVLGMIENPAVLSTYVTGKTSRSPPVYDMLIITTEDLKNGFIPLTYAHIAQGIITGIVTLDYICNTYPGIDVPEKIRNYLIEKYNTWGIEYVLIGGDNDTVPARLLWVDPLVEGISADTMPSDGYY
ncbi:MAG: hypothetical protein JXA00_06315, partial [Candidatus Thermoplasmatota archaeon]|nr:hypothetical protein [Candidatus Thermoplasmatota archaeon]